METSQGLEGFIFAEAHLSGAPMGPGQMEIQKACAVCPARNPLIHPFPLLLPLQPLRDTSYVFHMLSLGNRKRI